MLIKLFQDHAEKYFLEALENPKDDKEISGVALIGAFSSTTLKPLPETIQPLLKPILGDQEADLFFCSDGDMVIHWHGKIKETMEAVIKQLSTYFLKELKHYDPSHFFHLYDLQAEAENFLLFLRKKLNPIPYNLNDGPLQLFTPSRKIDFSELQQIELKLSLLRRAARKDISILVVEDQEFSRKLLKEVFDRQFVCYAAKDGAQALKFYAEFAPNLVFLDVELPDADGHDLASLFKRYDPESYIIMVTANNYAKDVKRAQENKVQGFIAKPYNKQNIFNVVNAYINRKKSA